MKESNHVHGHASKLYYKTLEFSSKILSRVRKLLNTSQWAENSIITLSRKNLCARDQSV